MQPEFEQTTKYFKLEDTIIRFPFPTQQLSSSQTHISFMHPVVESSIMSESDRCSCLQTSSSSSHHLLHGKCGKIEKWHGNPTNLTTKDPPGSNGQNWSIFLGPWERELDYTRKWCNCCYHYINKNLFPNSAPSSYFVLPSIVHAPFLHSQKNMYKVSCNIILQ